MKKIVCFSLCLLAAYTSTKAQTCTFANSGSLDWPADLSTIGCVEGGTAASASILVIPAGLTVNLNNITNSWTGTRIEIWGSVTVAASVTFNTSIVVENGGLLLLQSMLALGTADPGCSYTVTVETGGTIDVDNSGEDRLTICGRRMMKGSAGGGSCNDCGGGSSMGKCPMESPAYKPYCEPPGGFIGPTGYGRNGYDATLPIDLLYFTASRSDEKIALTWATKNEVDFLKFVVQRSNDGLTFEDIGEVAGKGFDIYDIESQYAFNDEAPFLGFNYYRLKAIDLDESFEYFGVKAVKVNGSKKLALYPNPSTGEVISFHTNFNPSESDRIVLMNQLGVEILNAPASAVQNEIHFHDKLRAGIYLLRYVSKDFEQSARVVVKN